MATASSSDQHTHGHDAASGGGAPPATLDPSPIIQIGLGFMASKVLLSAVSLGLFTTLGSGALTAREIAERLGLGSRALPDFLDALVALHLLEREGLGDHAYYRNTPVTAAFLDRGSPQYLGGLLEIADSWMYTSCAYFGDFDRVFRSKVNESFGAM